MMDGPKGVRHHAVLRASPEKRPTEMDSAAWLVCRPDAEHADFLKKRWRTGKILSADTICELRRSVRDS